jgi:hypothetical protein
MPTEIAPIVDGETVARVLLHGDLKNLTASQKVSYYRAVCESVGLNPLTQPFQYLVLNGKEILYARREASEQLRKMHAVSIDIVARELVEGTYTVTARATLPDGRRDESIGAKWLGELKGEVRANAIMACESKAKRRVTLSICGLGMLDETEVADIPAPAMGHYDTVQAPPPPALEPPAPDPDLPDGFVRVLRLDSAPTKNPSVVKYSVTLSTGEVVTTINQWLATLAQDFCEQKTPVRAETKKTKWGTDLVSLKTTEAELPLEPPPITADDIPF